MDRCELCSLVASSVYNVLAETHPIQDEKGDWWKNYKFVSGPHLRCGLHKMSQEEHIIPLNQDKRQAFDNFLLRSAGYG